MQQSHAYNDPSLALTTEVLDAKARKNLSWQDLADGTGLGLRHRRPARPAPTAGKRS